MRLLNVHTLELHEFFDKDRPTYVVLSHRWGENEVSYKDFRKGKNCYGPGYDKIVDFCKTVKELKIRIEWVWIDTCCIDKRSSAELSEAINSMFRWYQEAMLCIAFLADVSSSEDDDAAMNRLPIEFGLSSWFTREWTLQELLAPSQVVFYSADWNVLGHVGENGLVGQGSRGPNMNRGITKLTGIPCSGLEQSFTPETSNTCIAQRMSWATGRETTRIEDTAYCLLGIFEINMPLLYGEGKRAFRRLQEEIIRRSTDDSIFAWTTPRGLYAPYTEFGILASSPAAFEHSWNIKRRRNACPGESGRPGWAITNRGLEMHLLLEKVSGPGGRTHVSEGTHYKYDSCRFWRLQCTQDKMAVYGDEDLDPDRRVFYLGYRPPSETLAKRELILTLVMTVRSYKRILCDDLGERVDRLNLKHDEHEKLIQIDTGR